MKTKFILLISLLYLSLNSCSKKNTEVKEEKKAMVELKKGNLAIKIDQNTGGRIISFQLNDEELLKQENPELPNYGSTFWTAPQSDWNWPPYPAIHEKAYQIIKQSDDYLEIESAADASCGFQVKKQFSLDDNGKLEITYQLKNISNEVKKAGPWEISVVPDGGLTLFPQGSSENLETSTLSFNQNDSVQYFFYEEEVLKNQQKLFAYPKTGWLGHLNNNNLLFIKEFEAFPLEKVTPTHGLVEVYINKELKYIELENHGKFQELQPGEVLTYKVNWYLKKLNDDYSSKESLNKLTDQITEILQ